MSIFREATTPTTRRLLLGAGHLAALWALAFAQPLFDLLGKNPDFFVARGNGPGDIVILGLTFILLPPLVMLAAEWLAAKIGPRAYLALHLALFTVLAGFLFVQLVDPLLGGAWPLVVLVALGLGALLAIASVRVKFVNNLFDILIVAPVAILAIFLFASDSSKVVFPEEATASVGATVTRDVPVVLVTFDELGTVNLLGPDERLDAERFPNFARMAEESTWYPNYTTTSFFTPTALPGILTGNRPADGALPTASEQPESIFSLLADSYRFHVLEPITQLCAEELCPAADEATQPDRLRSLGSDLRYVVGRLVLPGKLAETLPDVGTNFEGFGENAGGGTPEKEALFVKGREGRSTPEEYVDFIRAIPRADRALTMMHVKQPHQPWKYGVEGQQYDPGPINQLSESTGKWLVDPYGVASAQQRMMVQTGFADTLLGEVLDQLERTGLWQDAMVIVTADHGISFEGGTVPQRQADERAMGEVANPPLLIKYPGEDSGRTDPRHVLTLDLVPTIARELGIEGGYETDGFPIQGDLPGRGVTVENISFAEFTVSMPQLIAQRKAAIERQRERFGDGPLYTLGPAPELVGTRAPAPPRGGARVAALDRANAWNDYRPGQVIVPMYVNGTVRGLKPGEPVAVGVNGRIRGTTRVFPFEGETRFGTVIDPATLRRGSNLVSVYRIDGTGLSYLGGNRDPDGS